MSQESYTPTSTSLPESSHGEARQAIGRTEDTYYHILGFTSTSAITHACCCYKSRCRTVGEPWIVKRESLAFTVCQRLVERSVRLGAAANVRGGGVDETISATMGARRRELCSSGGPGPAAAAAR